jgi:TPR repeat protein
VGPAAAGGDSKPSQDLLDELRNAKAFLVREREQETATLERQCSAGDGTACLDVARTHVGAGGADDSRGVRLAQRSCELGIASGCFLLADVRAHAEGGARDLDLAAAANTHGIDLLTRAACGDGGSLMACVATLNAAKAASSLGELSLSPNKATAACERGDARACMALASLSLGADTPIPSDARKAREYEDRAITLWQVSCDEGAGASCSAVAEVLRAPDPRMSDARPDYPAAAKYAQRGCNEYRDANSCLILSGLYERGEGVSQDHVHAERCRRAAALADTLEGCP